MNSQEYELLLSESCEHLKQGRFRMALKSAEKAYSENPDDERGICCYAKAKLENGFPDEAIDLTDIAVQNSNQDPESLLCRAYILYRAGIFDSALADLKYIIVYNKSLFDAYLLISRVYAALEKYSDAEENIEYAIKIKANEETEYLKNLISILSGYSQKIFSKSISKKDTLLEYANEAVNKKEYWFVLWASREILKDRKYFHLHKTARLLELESLFYSFRYREAFDTAEKFRSEYEDDAHFNLIYRRILKKYPEGELKTGRKPAGYSEYFDNNYFTVKSIRSFDFIKSVSRKKRNYLIQFDEKEIRYIGVEVIIENPFYNNRDIDVEGTAVWYLNDVETGRYKFKLKLKKEWKVLDFVQSWGTDEPVFWKKGTGKVVIMLDDNAVCAKYFDIKDFEIPEEEEPEKQTAGPEPETIQGIIDNRDIDSAADIIQEENNVEYLLNDLNNLIGLNAVKQSLWDFVTYLKFLNERKKHGLKTTEEFSVHCVFTGNPGTGKTTIARKLGKIFKAMGILRSGHVIEVDRAALVGQYVGETAQKTEKIIQQASGGILFIDEAYSLSKSSGQDFGQEAVDILLKRMEDHKEDFVVIAAGYPSKMQNFINSNPGLKSRFNHFFNFEDYTPEELISIFKKLASEEDYIITEDSLELLKKEFIRLYRKREEHFGNARVPINYLNSIKLKVSKRLAEEGQDLTKEAFTLIIKDDVEKVFAEEGKIKLIYEIDEEKLNHLLDKLNSLTGLESVKKEISEIIKLTRYYIESGEDPQKNISGHLVFLGNPGTGKTSIARLFSEIYSALGILPKGHLIEVDRQALVGQYVGHTALKTKEVIDSAIGGTLFIDEVYSLLKKDESDFGRESIDTLIKRMEDDKGKFILIAAGYTDETNEFLNMNPGLNSRFYKSIKFEDYTPEELFVIAEKFLDDRRLKLELQSESVIKKFFGEAYQKRDKRFGNARFVRNVTEKIVRNHLLYLAGLGRNDRSSEKTNIISTAVVREIIDEHSQWLAGDESTPENVLKELNELVGLNEVKQAASKMISSIKVSGLREKRGFKTVPRVLHSVFYGNPGTGKFTTAKIFGQIFKGLGILTSGHIISANKLNMTAPYVGQSKLKTADLIKKAKGGVIYIEDAEFLESDLVQGSEIMEAILEGISSENNDIVMILSGNNNNFCNEVKSNQFLSKYFANFFHFEDFTPRQLVEIAYSLAELNSYSFDEGALQLLMDVFTDLFSHNRSTENAKLVKDILYRAISAQEERLFNTINPSDEDLTLLTYEDVRKATIIS